MPYILCTRDRQGRSLSVAAVEVKLVGQLLHFSLSNMQIRTIGDGSAAAAAAATVLQHLARKKNEKAAQRESGHQLGYLQEQEIRIRHQSHTTRTDSSISWNFLTTNVFFFFHVMSYTKLAHRRTRHCLFMWHKIDLRSFVRSSAAAAVSGASSASRATKMGGAAPGEKP